MMMFLDCEVIVIQRVVWGLNFLYYEYNHGVKIEDIRKE